MEFAKEQENEEDEVGSLSTTFQWQRLRQDGPVSVNHTDSIVHQLWTPTEREQAGDWPGLTNPNLPGFSAWGLTPALARSTQTDAHRP